MKGKRSLIVSCVAACIVAVLFPNMSSAQSIKDIRATMKSINGSSFTKDLGVQLVKVEYYTAEGAAGQTVLFDDRSRQSIEHWVPGDPRRGGFLDIAWLSDQVDGVAAGLDLAQTQGAVNRAMTTWDNVNCSYIPLFQLPDLAIDWGLVQFLAGFGGLPGWWADITQAGWLPGAFFDVTLGPGASSAVLGVTFTYVFCDPCGPPVTVYTDIDNNGKDDAAFREIYYNNDFPWGIDTVWPVDVETIVLHETGHGLSQDHFGKLFQTDKNGKFHFAPFALMNAGYTGIRQTVEGSDNGGHCSIWGSWPNN